MLPDPDTFVEDFLEHAGSQYYDPVKAHEYYLKTRELKGRKKAQALTTTNQKQGWAYVKDKLSKDKKTDLEKARKSAKAGMEGLRKDAENRAKAIRAKLEKAIADLKAKAETDSKKIADQAQAKIDALPPIPEGLPKARRLLMERARAGEIARIRGDARSKQGDLAKSTRAEGQKTRESAVNDSKKLATEVRGSIDSARQNYKKLRDDLVKKYENLSKTEYEAIRTTVR